jgi:hypothetical protein
MEDEAVDGRLELAGFAPKRSPVAGQYALSKTGEWENVDDLSRRWQHGMPAAGQRFGSRGLTREGQSAHLLCGIASGSPGGFKNALRAEAGVLTAGRPRQIPKRLDAFAGVDQIHPVAYFEPPNQGESLIRSEVDRATWP